MLSKRESNTIYETIVQSKLNPAEFDLGDTGEEVIITHNSGSIFKFSLRKTVRPAVDLESFTISGTEVVTRYDVKAVVIEGINETNSAPSVDHIIIVNIPRWLREIRLTVGVPDHWAELRRNRRSYSA